MLFRFRRNWNFHSLKKEWLELGHCTISIFTSHCWRCWWGQGTEWQAWPFFRGQLLAWLRMIPKIPKQTCHLANKLEQGIAWSFSQAWLGTHRQHKCQRVGPHFGLFLVMAQTLWNVADFFGGFRHTHIVRNIWQFSLYHSLKTKTNNDNGYGNIHWFFLELPSIQ